MAQSPKTPALLQRQADEARALRESQAEAEEAQRALDERERQALQEQDEDAARRKREEAADLEQERRHRRELKEAVHDRKIQELHKGSQAPTPPALPPELESYLNALDKAAAVWVPLPPLLAWEMV